MLPDEVFLAKVQVWIALARRGLDDRAAAAILWNKPPADDAEALLAAHHPNLLERYRAAVQP